MASARSLSLGSSVFAGLVGALASAPAVSAPVLSPSLVAGRRAVRLAVSSGRAALAFAEFGAPVDPALLASLRACWSAGRAAGVSAARLAALARVGRLVALVPGVAAAVASVGRPAFVGFVPAVCRLPSGPVSRFLPVGSGVVESSALVGGAVRIVLVGGRRLQCLVSGIGPAAADALLAACSAAAVSGVEVGFVGAPSPRTGAVLGGYFCGVLAA